MRRAPIAILCALSACTCDPHAGLRTYACSSDNECTAGWRCVQKLCVEGTGGTGGSGGGAAGGLAGGAAGGVAGGAAGGAAGGSAGGTAGGVAGGAPSPLPQN